MKQYKKISVVAMILLMILMFSGCCLSHEWQEATCAAPKTCVKCGETEGETLPHTWQNATCIAPKTCKDCGATEGEALPHKWQEATCLIPKICKDCGATEGEVADHIWQEATCTVPETCSLCGKTQGEPEEHTPGKVVDGDFDAINATRVQELKCSVCDAVIFSEDIPVDKFYTEGEYLLTVGQFLDRFQALAEEASLDLAIEPDKFSKNYNVLYEGEKLASIRFSTGIVSHQDKNDSGIERIAFRFVLSNRNYNKMFPKVSVCMLQTTFPNMTVQQANTWWRDALSGWVMLTEDGRSYYGLQSNNSNVDDGLGISF